MSDRTVIRMTESRREPIISPGGGGPVDPSFEARLARLEADIVAMRADLSVTRSDTSYIRGRLESLPSTWQMIATVFAGNVALAGLLLAAAKLFAKS